MNRRKRTIAVLSVIFLFISFGVYSVLTNISPYDQQFQGVVSEIRKHYKGYVIIELENQKEDIGIFNNTKLIIELVEAGDSLVKETKDNYILIYKKENDKYEYFEKFYYE